jgi:FkbM family methyltransferase
MEINQLLAKATRRIAQLPYGIYLAIQARRYYTPRFMGREDAWAVIDDYAGGLKLAVDRSAYLGGMLYWQGYQSPGELKLLRKLLGPDMVMADVGANQGEYTIFAASRLTRGAVVAFEPVPAIYANLARNIRLNGFRNVLPFNYGLFDHDDTLPMYTSEDTVIHGGFNEGLASVFASDYRKDSVAELQFRVFDAIFPRLGLGRLDIMKIDVEGAELQVLRGARQTLQRYHPRLIIEVNEPAFAAAGYGVGDLLAFLQQLDYSLAVIDHRGNTTPARAEALPPLCNILCE